MTGEMYDIDPVTAVEPDGTEWPYHAAIAKAVGGEVVPFDQYQGPYVVVGKDMRMGDVPYQYCPTHLEVVRLWVVWGHWFPHQEGELYKVYREDTDTLSTPCFTPEEAAQEAVALIRN